MIIEKRQEPKLLAGIFNKIEKFAVKSEICPLSVLLEISQEGISQNRKNLSLQGDDKMPTLIYNICD
jgi:hypothetical protein